MNGQEIPAIRDRYLREKGARAWWRDNVATEWNIMRTQQNNNDSRRPRERISQCMRCSRKDTHLTW
jgi:hypothetical protein